MTNISSVLTYCFLSLKVWSVCFGWSDLMVRRVFPTLSEKSVTLWWDDTEAPEQKLDKTKSFEEKKQTFLGRGTKKKRPVFVVFDYEGVRAPPHPPFVVTWESEIFWSKFLLWWMPKVLKRILHLKQTEKEWKKNYWRELKTPEFHLLDLKFQTIMNSEMKKENMYFI